MALTAYHEQITSTLGELHKRMNRMQTQVLREYQVSLLEYHILMLLRHGHPLNQNELSAALDVDKALISRQIRSMEQKGLLSGTTDPDCRRRKLLSLSQQAHELLPRLEEAHRQGLERLFSGLDERQLREFQFILGGLVEKL